MGKIKLFCFPYAGGSAAIFNHWRIHLATAVELKAVELAGRGKRINEALYQDVPEAIEDSFRQIEQELDRPYALFGHSMGCMIVHELAQKIRSLKLPPPRHIFFSGRGAPHVRKNEKVYHRMDNEEFRKEIIGLGGTPPEFFDHPELLELFLPMLKNDFKIAETATTAEKIAPLDCDITALFGKEDDLLAEECDEWKRYTKGICSIHHFEGGHFFLHSATPQLVKVINNTLLQDLYAMSDDLQLI